ncbi:MAG: LysR family transcriptional regulator [Novosphingobium sp.]|nr:LysR family transcriptional regulator [Novosphingobium sp.]
MDNNRRPRIDLLQLHYFVAVVDAGSITKASRMCHIAQPALSKRVASLEEELGVQLLHRGAFGVQATEEGIVLYHASQRVLRDVAALPDVLNSTSDNPKGSVRIGCQDSLTRLISRPLAKQVLATFPDIKLSATAGQSMEMYRELSEGTIDFALLVYDEEVHNVAVQLLIEEEMFVVAAPSLFQSSGDTISPEELVRMPFVFPSSTSVASGQVIVNMLGKFDTELNVVAMVDGDAFKALIADGLGCCVLPWSFVEPEISSGAITYRRISNTPVFRRIALCNSHDRPPSAATRAVSGLLCDLIETMLGNGCWQHARLVG